MEVMWLENCQMDSGWTAHQPTHLRMGKGCGGDTCTLSCGIAKPQAIVCAKAADHHSSMAGLPCWHLCVIRKVGSFRRDPLWRRVWWADVHVRDGKSKKAGRHPANARFLLPKEARSPMQNNCTWKRKRILKDCPVWMRVMAKCGSSSQASRYPMTQ